MSSTFVFGALYLVVLEAFLITKWQSDQIKLMKKAQKSQKMPIKLFKWLKMSTAGRPEQKVSKNCQFAEYTGHLRIWYHFYKVLVQSNMQKRMLLNRNGLTMTNWSDWTFCYQNPHPSFKNMHLARQCHSFSKKEEELHDHVTWGG